MRNTIKLVAYILSCSLAFSGCGIRLNRPNKTIKIDDIKISLTPTSNGGKNPNLESIEEDIKETIGEKLVTDIPDSSKEEISKEDKELEHNKAYVTTNLNVRSSNSTDSLIIGSLSVSDVVYRILTYGKWDLVKCNNMVGYVYNEYLDYSAGEYKDEYHHQEYHDLVLTTANLNFRTGPGTDNDVMNILPVGTELKVAAKTNNDWLLVQHNGNFGYVHGDYVVSLNNRLKQTYPNLDLNNIDIEQVVYSTTTLNIRNGNSVEYEKIGQLEKYETLRVLGEYEEWYLVMTNDYQFGFVSKEYTNTLKGIFIVVDKSKQQLFMYQNDELLYTTPVTTGKDETPSDTGLFKVFRMATDTYLVGEDYREFVEFWIQYNGGEGIHDARWRSSYGGEDYHTRGSHGCINTPREVVEKVYQLTSISTPVIVHK